MCQGPRGDRSGLSLRFEGSLYSFLWVIDEVEAEK